MSSTFSRYRLSNSDMHYIASAPAGHHRDNHIHQEPLGRSLPLLLYPSRVEPGLYDGSYRNPPSSSPSSSALFPFLGPFHGRFGIYECPFEPAFIQKRNERERQRVKCVNQGYAKLRHHLPGATAEKRMSKVETLRAAIRYIKYLQRLVEGRERTTEKKEEEEECREGRDEEEKSPLSSGPDHLVLHRKEPLEAKALSRDAA